MSYNIGITYFNQECDTNVHEQHINTECAYSSNIQHQKPVGKLEISCDKNIRKNSHCSTPTPHTQKHTEQDAQKHNKLVVVAEERSGHIRAEGLRFAVYPTSM